MADVAVATLTIPITRQDQTGGSWELETLGTGAIVTDSAGLVGLNSHRFSYVDAVDPRPTTLVTAGTLETVLVPTSWHAKGGTIAGTLNPEQFQVKVYSNSGGTLAALASASITTAPTFMIRGR